MAYRSESSLPADLDLSRRGMRSESRRIVRAKPRTLGQLRGTETDLVAQTRTRPDGSGVLDQSIWTSAGRVRLS